MSHVVLALAENPKVALNAVKAAAVLGLVLLILLLPLTIIAIPKPADIKDLNGDGTVTTSEALTQYETQRAQNPFTSVCQGLDVLLQHFGDGLSPWDKVALSILLDIGADPRLIAITTAELKMDTINPVERLNAIKLKDLVIQTTVLQSVLGEKGGLIASGVIESNKVLGVATLNGVLQGVCAGALAEGNIQLAALAGILASVGGIDGNPWTPW